MQSRSGSERLQAVNWPLANSNEDCLRVDVSPGLLLALEIGVIAVLRRRLQTGMVINNTACSRVQSTSRLTVAAWKVLP
jgi:hypothetical protein